LVALLGLALLGNLLNGAFSFWAWRTFRGWVDEPAAVDLEQATAYDTGTAVAALVLSLVHLAVLVLMITWLFQAHRSDRMDPSRLEHRSGWAIGGWFVPFLNLVRPYQVVEDVRVASQSSLGRQSDVVLAWWLTVIGASIAGRVTAALVSGAGASDSETISAIASANLSDVVGSVLWVAAAVLGILVVRSTTRLVQQSPHVPVSAAA
jgi:hypothetical protein